MFEDFDRQVSIFSESVARSISRRKVLTTSIKGVVITIAGATIGTFVDLKDVFAAGCTCNWYDGSGNANCPKHPGCNPTGAAGCPSGCSTCTSSDYCLDSKGYYCNYSSGSWISCTGQGTCGNGHKICIDCKCPNLKEIGSQRSTQLFLR